MIRSRCIRVMTGFIVIAMPLSVLASSSKTQQWAKTLQSDASLFEKVRACQQLGEFGTEEAIGTLAVLLDHEQLSTYARAGLERIEGPASSAALRAALDRVTGVQRIGVIHSLAVLRDEKAVPALSTLMDSSDPSLAQAALLALGRIANARAIVLVRGALTDGPESLRPHAATACLLAAEQQLDQGKRKQAQSLYDTVRRASVPESYRIGATRGAILSRQEDQVSFLIQQLRSYTPALCDVALLTIRDIPSDTLATALTAELNSASPDLQVKLLAALKDCHNNGSLRVIRAKTVSDHAGIRLTAVRVLADIGGAGNAPTFLQVIAQNQGADELAIAITALEQMTGPEVNTLIVQALKGTRTAHARIPLIHLLDTRNVTDAAGELLHLAERSDPALRVAALQALRSLADDSELPRLIALTKACPRGKVRDAAVLAVSGACENSDSVEAAGALVLKALQTAEVAAERDPWIRVLSILGYADALPVIVGQLKKMDPTGAQATLTHLSRWPNPSPIDLLFERVENGSDSGLRGAALKAILRLTIAAVNQNQATDEQLVAWFQRASQSVRSVSAKRSLLSGLGRVKHIDSVHLAATYLDDPEVKLEAAYAIVNAARPLVKGPECRAVAAVLKKMSGIKDQRLVKQIRDLERDIQATLDKKK